MNQLAGTLRRLMPVIFAVILGLVAVLIMRQYLVQEYRKVERERQRLLADFQAPVKILVAAKDLPEGTALEAGHLATISVPQKFIQPFAARTPNELLGLVTLAPVAEGEQLLTNKVRRPDVSPASSTLSGVMPKGKRAVTIGVDAISGVGGFVRPGDNVDVLWTVKLPGQAGEVVTLTLFQDVSVFAVGRDIVGRPVPAGAGAGAPGGAAYNVTLALVPQEISFLLFAREQGRIQLSLRPKQEGGEQIAISPATSATFNQFMEAQLGIERSEPVEAPRPPKQIEVYKGLERDVVLLSDGGGQGR